MLIISLVLISVTETASVRYGGCMTISVLVHYFALVAVMWMGAEALLMFRKVVIVFVHITTKYIVTVSLVCWCKLIYNGVIIYSGLQSHQHTMKLQWSPSITDTTGAKDFVLYSKVSFAQGVIVDHAPLTIMASYAGARLWTMKSVVLMKDLLLFSP